jgi:hypothetical protein
MRIVPRTLWQVLPLIVVLLLASGAGARAQDAADQNRAALTESSWRSQSLRDQTATGPKGSVTTAEALTVNQRMGVEVKAVTELASGLYSLAGWGIGISYAIDAPDGWIIIGKGVGPINYNLDTRDGLCEGKTWQENRESSMTEPCTT